MRGSGDRAPFITKSPHALWWSFGSSGFSVPAQIIYATSKGLSTPLPHCMDIWVNSCRLLRGRTWGITTACTSQGIAGYFQMEIQLFQWWVFNLTYLKLTVPFGNQELWPHHSGLYRWSSWSDHSPCLNVWNEGGKWGVHRAQGIGILFKVAWISPDSSMAPFINVHSAWVSVGIKGGGQSWCWGREGEGFCLIISKLLTGPSNTKTNFSFTISFWGLVPNKKPPLL